MLKLFVLLVFLWVPLSAVAQDTQDFRNFPIVVSIQFQSFSMPFQNLKGHFRNLGIGIGTEVSYGGDPNWIQHFDLMWFRNKTMGNGIVISTQSGWRPYLVDPLYSEIKLGAAYFYNFRPTDSFQQRDGKWNQVGKKGRGIFAIPAGITIGSYDSNYNSLFVGYQFMLTTNYSKSLPVTPWSFLKVGTSYNPK